MFNAQLDQELRELGLDREMERYLDEMGYPVLFCMDGRPSPASEIFLNSFLNSFDDAWERYVEYASDLPAGADDLYEGTMALMPGIGRRVFISVDQFTQETQDALAMEVTDTLQEAIDNLTGARRKEYVNKREELLARVQEAPLEYEILFSWSFEDVLSVDHDKVREAPVLEYSSMLLDAKKEGVRLHAMFELVDNWEQIRQAHTEMRIPYADLFIGY